MHPVSRRSFLRHIGRRSAAAGLAFSVLRPPGASGQERTAARPNLVFILADDLGWAELGCYGNRFNDTPHLDRLAREGMRFTQAYAAAPVCSPMRASFMTGQYPARVGITDYLRPNDEKYLSPDHVTLAEMLGRAGYVCGLIGKWHLTGDYTTRRGEPSRHGFHEVVCSESRGIGGGSYFPPYHFNPAVKPRAKSEYLTDRLNHEAVRFIQRHRNEPFFLFLSHYAVHTRLAAKRPVIEKYAKKPGAGKTRNNPILAAMLESIDDGAGIIRKALDELGIAEQTVVIFMSDNGGERRVTSNAPLRGAKSQLYEGGIREPLIVRWPGRAKPGSVCGVPVSSVDFYPTFLEMAGVKPDPRQVLDGVSLVPLLTQTAGLKRDTLYWHYPLARRHFLGGRSSGAIRKGDWKLIEFFDTGAIELYDLKNDVGETTDLAGKMPEKVSELRGLLAEWRKSVGAGMPPAVTGLQLHLAFDEPAGAKAANDSSPSKRTLTYHGTAPAPGRRGKARRFNGKNDFLDLPRSQAPAVARQPIAIAAWVRPEKPNGVVLAHGGDRLGYVLYLKDGRPTVSVCVDWKRATISAKERLPSGWAHVAGQLLRGGRLKLFVNGKLAAQGKAPGLLSAEPGDSLQVGADAIKPVGEYEGNNPFAGLIDEVRLVVGPCPENILLQDFRR